MEFKLKYTSSPIAGEVCEEVYKKVFTTHHEQDGPMHTNWTEAQITQWASNPQIKNFRIEGGRHYWDWEEEAWCVSINTLEELMAFQDKYGNLVIFDDTIEIYNGYRE